MTAISCSTPSGSVGGDTTPPTSDGKTTTPVGESVLSGEDETFPVETTPPESKEPETPEEMLALFEKKDYGNKAFNILTANVYNASISVVQAAEGYNGDVVNDALYERDLMIEDYLGIDIVYKIEQHNADLVKTAKTIAEAGLSDFDLIFGGTRASAAPLAISAYLTDLNSLDNIDLNKDYWNQFLREMEIVGKMYFATGEITTRYMSSPNLLSFNEKLLASYGHDMPYQKVYDGAWTVEELYKIVKDTAQDLNQDGTLTDADDFVGMSGSLDTFYAFCTAAGQPGLVLNDKGIPVVNNTETCINVIDKLASYLTIPDIKMQDEAYSAHDAFKNNRSLFLLSATCDLQVIADMPDTYGILPLPKYTLEQDTYRSLCNPYISTSIFIFRSANDAEWSAEIAEIMAAVSSVTSAPAQYENIMQLRQARNEDSMKCLQIATKNQVFDFTYIYQWGNQLATIMRKSILDGEPFASTFAAAEESVNAQILKAIAKMR